ncbi:hypothetical protein C8F04DRAFT_1276887 [Mycena alexandri]|uniref:Uncharacterized protein n=1 Tax=Mycena alexandri TaxID=1745969 RepID=A0AAD6WS52_9AGAR|nr:hypothetical protein C8F04DRAFT_1276887 [Mycena alexandri]
MDPIDCFQSVPLLVDVTSFNECGFPSIPFPPHQLTSYRLVGPWEIHENLSKMSPNLVQAGVMIEFDDEPWPATAVGEIIQMLCLRNLCVSDEILVVEVEEQDRRVAKHLVRSINRSSVALRALCFLGWLDTPSLCQVLQELPSITTLALILDDYSTAQQVEVMVEALTVSEDAAMVKSRWESPFCALNRTELLTDKEHSIDSVTRNGLSGLRAEGLHLVLLEGEEAIEPMLGWTFQPTWK